MMTSNAMFLVVLTKGYGLWKWWIPITQVDCITELLVVHIMIYTFDKSIKKHINIVTYTTIKFG